MNTATSIPMQTMSWIRDKPQSYCSICGAPMLESSDIWLSDAILLTTVHKTENGDDELDEYFTRSSFPSSPYTVHLGKNPPEEASRRVLRLKAKGHDSSDQFHLTQSGELVEVGQVKVQRGETPAESRGGPLYLPVHRICLQVADRFIDSVGVSKCTVDGFSGGSITSVTQLWEVLSHRLDGSCRSRLGELPEPHDYFGGQYNRNVYWEGDDDPEEEGELLEQDPWDIPNLTESVLENLEPMPANYKEVSKIESQELTAKESTTLVCYNIQDADLDCEYTRSSDWWCAALAGKEIFPWLWDLDVNLLQEQKQSGSWNWELLVRQISQTKIHDPLDTSVRVPLALRNRRRIWRILEEARVNDVAEREIVERSKLLKDEKRREFTL